ncbi:unnamed protein product [Calypogeia fissa]
MCHLLGPSMHNLAGELIANIVQISGSSRWAISTVRSRRRIPIHSIIPVLNSRELPTFELHQVMSCVHIRVNAQAWICNY